MRRAVGLAVVVAAVAGLAVGWRWMGDVGRPDSAVPLYRVDVGRFERKIVADGNLEATDATVLGPPAESRSAQKIAWLAPDGSRVEEGDVVIRFDPTEMEDNLRNGRHDQATADTKIERQESLDVGKRHALDVDARMAGLELDYANEFRSRDRTIFSRSEIVESEIDRELAGEKKTHSEESEQIHAELAAAELELLAIERRKAEIKVSQAEEGLQKLEVRAPHAGIFVLKQFWNGLPEVGQTVWGGQPLAEIPKMDKMKARVFVLEADAGGLEVGVPATLTVDAFPGREWTAKVTQVDALAQRRNRRVPVQYFGVTLELDETDPDLMKPGGRVQAELMLDAADEVIAIPRQAVCEEEGEKVVYRRRGAVFEAVPVELGAASLGRVVVTSGLDAGDVIALRDPDVASGSDEEASTSSAPLGAGS